MASLQQYQSGGHKYWRVVESYRQDGRPKIRVLAHLGTAANLLSKLQDREREIAVRSKICGDVAALWAVATELEVATLIDRALQPHYPHGIPKRQGLTPGQACVLIALGRVCRPTSKMGWGRWAGSSILPEMVKADASKLTSQFFWDQMDAIPLKIIPDVERELAARALARHQQPVDLVLYDTTNFFTFIASTNERCNVAQRGKNKQRRIDLRQVGLALLVTRGSRVPLWHQIYQGNRPDVKVFPEILGDLRRRLGELIADVKQVTFVCDRGNNASRANQELLDEAEFYYVAALTPANHCDLIAKANSRLQPVPLGTAETVQAYRDKRQIWGAERTVIVYVSETLRAGQIRGLEQHLHKKIKALTDLSQRLLSPRSKPRSVEKVKQEVERIVAGQHVNKVLRVEISERATQRYSIDWHIDSDQYDKLVSSEFGRGILITDRHEWRTADILKAYRGQSDVECVFRTVKNPFHCAFRPQHHWTDQKIEVHGFCCVLGYLLARLLHMKVLETTSFRGDLSRLLDLLQQVRRAVIVEPPAGGRGRPRVRHRLDYPDEPLIKELIDALELTA